MENDAGVYLIHNTVTDRVYIGEAGSVGRRWRFHRGSLERGRHHISAMQHDWNAFGPSSFAWFVLESTETTAERKPAEQCWIDLFRVDGFGLYNGKMRTWKRDPYKRVNILEHPRRSKPPCFGLWISVQRRRDDNIGALARWIVKDGSWPRLAQTVGRFVEFLEDHGASAEQQAVLQEAWHEYMSIGGWFNNASAVRKHLRELARLFGVPTDSIRLPALNGKEQD